MDKTGRPISPHLMIYAFPTIAMSSVTVRITGAMATFGFFGVASLACIGDGNWTVGTVQDLVAIAPTTAKFSIAYVLSYQWFGSARHLYWDLTAKGFNNHVMYQGAIALFALTGVLSAALAVTSLPPVPSDEKQKKEDSDDQKETAGVADEPQPQSATAKEEGVKDHDDVPGPETLTFTAVEGNGESLDYCRFWDLTVRCLQRSK